MSIDDEALARLRLLLASMTPGRWTVTDDVMVVTDDQPIHRSQVAAFVEPDDAQLIAAAVNALPALLDIAEAVAQQCVWTQDDHDESWDSACGEKWQFTADGPAENNVRFCHGCGHKVSIVPCTGGGE